MIEEKLKAIELPHPIPILPIPLTSNLPTNKIPSPFYVGIGSLPMMTKKNQRV